MASILNSALVEYRILKHDATSDQEITIYGSDRTILVDGQGVGRQVGNETGDTIWLHPSDAAELLRRGIVEAV